MVKNQENNGWEEIDLVSPPLTITVAIIHLVAQVLHFLAIHDTNIISNRKSVKYVIQMYGNTFKNYFHTHPLRIYENRSWSYGDFNIMIVSSYSTSKRLYSVIKRLICRSRRVLLQAAHTVMSANVKRRRARYPRLNTFSCNSWPLFRRKMPAAAQWGCQTI